MEFLFFAFFPLFGGGRGPIWVLISILVPIIGSNYQFLIIGSLLSVPDYLFLIICFWLYVPDYWFLIIGSDYQFRFWVFYQIHHISSELMSEFYNPIPYYVLTLLRKIWYQKFQDQFWDNPEIRWPTSSRLSNNESLNLAAFETYFTHSASDRNFYFPLYILISLPLHYRVQMKVHFFIEISGTDEQFPWRQKQKKERKSFPY